MVKITFTQTIGQNSLVIVVEELTAVNAVSEFQRVCDSVAISKVNQ
jgi:hypothetical protein